MPFMRLEPPNLRPMIEQGVALLREKLERFAKRSSTPVPDLAVTFGDPLTDAELDEVQAQIGFELDPRFVALFRSANGFRVAVGTRLVHVRPLRDLFGGTPEPVFSTLTATKLLGGVSGAELAARARPLGRVTDLRSDYAQVLAVFASPQVPDPVALLVTEHGAAAGDHRPVRARGLIWLLALQLDVSSIMSEGWFEPKGFDGEHPVVELDLETWELPSDLDEDENFFVGDVLNHLKGEAGLKGWAPTPRPSR